MPYELMTQPIIFGGYAPDKIGGSLGNYSPDLKNIKFNLDGGIETVKGYVKFNPYQFKDGAVTDMFNIQNGYEDYVLLQVRKTGTSLSGLVSEFDYINIAGTVAPLSSFSNDYYGGIDCAVLNNIAFICSPSQSWYWRIPTGAMIYAYSPSVMAGVAAETHFSRVFVALDSRVDFSNIYDPLTFTTATDYFYVNKDDGDTIRGMKSFMGDLYIFKKFSCYKVVGTDFDATTGNYSIVKMIQIPGCLSGKSIVIANGKMYWISPEGAIEFDGSSTPKRIGKGIIDNTLLDQLTNHTPQSRDPYPQPWIGVHNKATNEIWWSANDAKRHSGSSSTAGSTITTIYSYNYIMEKWSVITPADGNYPVSFVSYNSVSTLKSTVLMGGLISGYIHQWDNTSVSADGGAIDSYYCTDFLGLGNPLRQKDSYKLMLDTVREGRNFLSCSHYYDYDPVAADTNQFNLDTSVSDQYYEEYLDAPLSRRVKLKLAVNTLGLAFKINQATLQFRVDNGII